MKKKGISLLSVLSALALSLMTFASSAFAAEGTTEQETTASLSQEATGEQGESSDLQLESTSGDQTQAEADEESNNSGVEEDLPVDSNSVDADIETADDSVDGDELAEENVDEFEYDEDFYSQFPEEIRDDVKALGDAIERADFDLLDDEVDFGMLEPVDGTYVLDYSDIDNAGLIYTFSNFDYESQQYLPIPPGQTIVTKYDEIEVSMPTDNFPGISYGLAIFKDTDSHPTALSTVYDFYFMTLDESLSNLAFFHQFANPVTLKFVIDSTKVKNWDDVKVVYINNLGEQQEVLNPKNIKHLDNNLAEITVDVNHFSKYGVFEIAAPDNANNEDNNSSDTNSNSNSNSNTNTSTNSNTNSNINNNSGTSVATATSTAKVPSVAKASKELPNTSTNSYNALLFGTVLLAFGLLFSRKKGKKLA